MNLPTRILEKPCRSVTNDGRSVILYVTDQGVFNIQQLSKILKRPTNTLYYRIQRNWKSKHVFSTEHAAKITRVLPERHLPVQDCDFMKLSNIPRNRNLAKINTGSWERRHIKVEATK